MEWVPGDSWGAVNKHIAWYTSPYPWSRSVRWCLAEGLACGDKRLRTGSGSALQALRDDALYKYMFTVYRKLLRGFQHTITGGRQCTVRSARLGYSTLASVSTSPRSRQVITACRPLHHDASSVSCKDGAVTTFSPGFNRIINHHELPRCSAVTTVLSCIIFEIINHHECWNHITACWRRRPIYDLLLTFLFGSVLVQLIYLRRTVMRNLYIYEKYLSQAPR